MSEMVEKAWDFTSTLMRGKVCKGCGAPYMSHVHEVFRCAASYAVKEGKLLLGENLQSALILHDVVEDCGVTLETLGREFNPAVAKLVLKVTEDKTLPWRERRGATINIAEKSCQAVGMILMADKISALQAFVRETAGLSDDAFHRYWSGFNAGYGDQLWFAKLLVQALQINVRLRKETEYPELRTSGMIRELLDLVEKFERILVLR